MYSGREKAMSRSFYTRAIRCCACKVEDSSIDEPGGNRTAAIKGTKAEEPKGRDPIAETAADDWILETGRPREGTTGDTLGA